MPAQSAHSGRLKSLLLAHLPSLTVRCHKYDAPELQVVKADMAGDACARRGMRGWCKVAFRGEG